MRLPDHLAPPVKLNVERFIHYFPAFCAPPLSVRGGVAPAPSAATDDHGASLHRGGHTFCP